MSSIYGEFESCLHQVMAEVRGSLEAYDKKTFRETGEHIYEHFNMRIKQDQSVREKCRRKGLPETAYSALHELRDSIGLRIVTAFRDDIHLIVEEIRRMDRVTVVAEKDYIRHAKPNGYRSYHMVLQVTTDLPDVEGNVPGKYFVEVQIRTIAMDSWASLEHKMKYKKDIKNIALIEEELKRCADELAACDVSMQTIRNLIRDS